MIIDLRTYTTKPGLLPKFLDIYKSMAWSIQTKYLPKCAGYYTVEIGVQNRVVHLWQYADIAERARCRAAMMADPGWGPYGAAASPCFATQDNRIMIPTPFEPIDQPDGKGIVDKRTYFVEPGRFREWAELYKGSGYAIQRGHLGRCIGFYLSDIGPLHQIVHLWAYTDLADRQKRRTALFADPAWNAYYAKAAPMFTHQENEILRPAPFWTPG